MGFRPDEERIHPRRVGTSRGGSSAWVPPFLAFALCNAAALGWGGIQNQPSPPARPPAQESQREPKLQVPTGHAIPEAQAPILPDGPTKPPATAGGDPDEPSLIQEFAGLIRAGKFQDVEPRLVEYLTARPRSSQAHYFYGYILFRQHRLGDAIRELAKSLELDTHNAEAHKVLGRALSILGRYDLALHELNAASRLLPDSAEVYYNRGRIYSIQDDFHKARAEFEAALRLDPDYMEAHNALGFALEALGDDAAALASYQKAIQLSEQQGAKFDAPYVNMSGYYGRRGEFQTSLDYARKALELNPSSDLAYYQMAKTYRTMEDWPHAAEALEKAIALKPTSAQYHYVLSSAYRKLGRNEESRKAMEEFRKIERQTAELEKQRRETRRATLPPDPGKSE
jgi:tetratricopeptide (TPR) repeat protein